MFYLLKTLVQIKLLTFKSLFFFIQSLLKDGFNLLGLLNYVCKISPNSVALDLPDQQITYKQLYTDCYSIALSLQKNYELKKGDKVAVLCRNHQACVQSIISLSALGIHIYLLNVEMHVMQLKKIIDTHAFNFIIYDEEKEVDLDQLHVENKILAAHTFKDSITQFVKNKSDSTQKIKSVRSGKIIVLTGGSSGNFKTAERKPSILNFSNPLAELLTKLKLNTYDSVYIATPIYHGYGFSALITSLLLGKRIFLRERFSTQESTSLTQKNKIEVLVLVPIMLQRMLISAPESFQHVQCILSGGAPIDPALVVKTASIAGHTLFNLYGSSEAGFSILATPADLKRYPATIGKPIYGVDVTITNNKLEVATGEVGMICIKCRWVMDSLSDQWAETGDLGFKNKDGYIFLRGRKDNMIISGGENVYPEEVESILLEHESIQQAAVIGVSDAAFGQRLKAFVVEKAHACLSEEILLKWLHTKVARYQMPAQIILVESIPMLETGKLNTKELLNF